MWGCGGPDERIRATSALPSRPLSSLVHGWHFVAIYYTYMYSIALLRCGFN
jgi:hypothetical protein